MNHFAQRDLQHSITRAILAIENLRERTRRAETLTRKAQREIFFEFLDVGMDSIAAGIDIAAREGRRELSLSILPGFVERAKEIFPDYCFGSFDVSLLDDWLRARDLGHILHGSPVGLKW